MYELDWYERNMGMLISYEKTTIYRIGSLHYSEAKFTSACRVSWVNTPINVLGIFVSHDQKECKELNINPILEKIKNLVNIWKLRGLTLIGKIQVLNSLIASLFVYKMSVLPLLEKETINKLRQIFTDFIWDGKKPKIKLDILSLLKEQGGLNLANMEAKDKALKAQWVMRIKNNEKLKTLADNLMHNQMGHLFWKCHLFVHDIDKVFPNVDLFWKDVMKAWFEVNESWIHSEAELKESILWYNSQIRIGGIPIFDLQLFRNGLTTVGQLIDKQNRLISCEKFIELFKCPGKYLIYRAILKSFPQHWKNLLADSTNTSLREHNYDKWENVVKLSNLIYKCIVYDDSILTSHWHKWRN